MGTNSRLSFYFATKVVEKIETKLKRCAIASDYEFWLWIIFSNGPRANAWFTLG